MYGCVSLDIRAVYKPISGEHDTHETQRYEIYLSTFKSIFLAVAVFTNTDDSDVS